MKMCFCNNLLLAKLHPHPPLPASLFQHCCLFSSLLKYFPSLVSVTAFFSGSPLLFQVSIRQLPSSVSKFLFHCLRSSSFISILFINILKFIPHSLASILLKYLFLSRSEKGYYFSAFESNTSTWAYFWNINFLAFHQLNLFCVLFHLFFFDYNQYKLLGFAFLALHSLFLFYCFHSQLRSQLPLFIHSLCQCHRPNKHCFKQEFAFRHL